jgi:hypothetical protein
MIKINVIAMFNVKWYTHILSCKTIMYLKDFSFWPNFNFM